MIAGYIFLGFIVGVAAMALLAGQKDHQDGDRLDFMEHNALDLYRTSGIEGQWSAVHNNTLLASGVSPRNALDNAIMKARGF